MATLLLWPMPPEEVPGDPQAGPHHLARAVQAKCGVRGVREERVGERVSVSGEVGERDTNSGFRVRRAPRARTAPSDVMCSDCPCVRQPVPWLTCNGMQYSSTLLQYMQYLGFGGVSCFRGFTGGLWPGFSV